MTLYNSGAGGGPSGMTPASLDSAVAILAHMDTEQLEKMNEDESELIGLINDSEMVKRLQTEREELVAANKSLAEFNLALEPTLKSKKELLRELYVTQSEVFAAFDGKKQTMEKNTGATSLDTVLAILQSEAATTEEVSEELADQFLGNTSNIDEFLPAFREKRKQAHMQRIKSEKIQEMITNGLMSNGPPQEPTLQPQQQNNLNSSWNQPTQPNIPTSGYQAASSSQRNSPTRAAPPPRPSMPPYGTPPQPAYPAYGQGHGAPPTHGAYGTPPMPPMGIQTGPPPNSMPYPMGQHPAQTYPNAGGPPRGGWGQGRAPYQAPYPGPNPGYMAMPQPHVPSYR